jgi:pilus assembly protein CpaE
MNARIQPLNEREVVDHFVFASDDAGHLFWLGETLHTVGAVQTAALDTMVLIQQIGVVNPSIVFLDFTGVQSARASDAAAAVRASFPELPIVALGAMSDAGSALAALRAGVRDFVDVGGAAADALQVTRDVLSNLPAPITRRGKLTVILGARIGLGVSTLAANLSVLMQTHRDAHDIRQELKQGAAAANGANAVAGHAAIPGASRVPGALGAAGSAGARTIALLDLGLPANDGTLYLNTRCEFNFVDAVRNLRRFDQTFVHTALSRHASGLALMTLPFDLAEMREVSYSGAIGLVNRLRSFFDQQVVDLGGFANSDFTAQMARAADEVWLVCDQSVASIVSAVSLLEELRLREVDTASIGLIVNKFDAALDLAAEQIAERLQLPLTAVLPARAVAIGRAVNQGKLLAESAERDPYVRALEPLLDRLQPAEETRTGRMGLGARLHLGRLLPTSKKRPD